MWISLLDRLPGLIQASTLEFLAEAEVTPDKLTKASNAALEGTTLMLTSSEMRQATEDMGGKIEYVALETAPDFFDIFVEGWMFKPIDRRLG